MFNEDNMTHEDYIDYPTAILLKTAGFNYPCHFYYTKEDAPDGHVWHTTSEEAPIDYNRSVYAGCSMPTLAQAQKWLRETKGIALNISAHDRGCYSWSMTFLPNADNYDCIPRFDSAFYDTYEQCVSVALNAALGMIISNTEKKGIEVIVAPRYCNNQHIGMVYEWIKGNGKAI